MVKKALTFQVYYIKNKAQHYIHKKNNYLKMIGFLFDKYFAGIID
jgi:hypothetical protein